MSTNQQHQQTNAEFLKEKFINLAQMLCGNSKVWLGLSAVQREAITEATRMPADALFVKITEALKQDDLFDQDLLSLKAHMTALEQDKLLRYEALFRELTGVHKQQ